MSLSSLLGNGARPTPPAFVEIGSVPARDRFSSGSRSVRRRRARGSEPRVGHSCTTPTTPDSRGVVGREARPDKVPVSSHCVGPRGAPVGGARGTSRRGRLMRHCRRRRRAARRPWRLPLTARIPVPLAPVRPRHGVEPRPRRSARPALESTGGLWHLPGRRPPCRRTPRIHRWIPASAVLSSGPRSRVIVGSDGSVRASPRLMREHCAQRRTGIGTRTTYATSARSSTRGRTHSRSFAS